MKRNNVLIVERLYIFVIIAATLVLSPALFTEVKENGITKDACEIFSYISVFIISIVLVYQNILSRSSSEKVVEIEKSIHRVDLTNSIKKSEIQDIICKIDQLHNNLCDFDKRLHDISMEHSLIRAQGNHATDEFVCKVTDLIYDINFLRNNHINILIPTYFESNDDKLKELKSKIKSSLQQIYDELQSYHSYLTSVQNNNASTHRSSPPTIPIILFDEIHTTNSEFHKKLYTAGSYITFPS